MPIFEPITLTTPRLTLRFLEPYDADALFAIYADPQAMRYWSCAPWVELGQAASHIALSRHHYGSGESLRLAVTLAATGELIGTATLYAFNRANRRCEIGYLLSRAHWGQGYMPEALAALIDYGFGALDLHRIEADLHPDNQASATILERLHFRQEGRLRERWFVDGELSDSVIYGLLHGDWQAARR
jgi:[ribosomal protein S5]-alanine N-acetyltransferase